jgi:hypothetical protein
MFFEALSRVRKWPRLFRWPAQFRLQRQMLFATDASCGWLVVRSSCVVYVHVDRPPDGSCYLLDYARNPRAAVESRTAAVRWGGEGQVQSGRCMVRDGVNRFLFFIFCLFVCVFFATFALRRSGSDTTCVRLLIYGVRVSGTK